MTRVIVVTGCDVNHHDLAADLVASVRACRGRSVDVGFIAMGAPEPPAAITDLVDHLVRVRDDGYVAEEREGFKMAFLGIKPRIPEYFPGYDVYIWMDGDTWMQNAQGLDQLIHCSGLADICLHPESDPNYSAQNYPFQFMYNVYRSIYGEADARQFAGRPMLNAGVFAAKASSPVWRLWKEAMNAVAKAGAVREDLHFSDQIPLHRLVMSDQLSVVPLRAVNNWLAYLCPPAINFGRKLLMAPSYPFEEINIVHLVGPSKDMRFDLPDGRSTSFRYRDIAALFAG